MVMTGQNDEQILREHFKRFPQIGFVLDPSAFLLVMGTLQFALRNPQFGKMASGQKIRAIVDNLIERVSDGDAYVKSLLKRGDDPAHDVFTEQAQQAAPKGGKEFAADFVRQQIARQLINAVQAGAVVRFLWMLKIGQDKGVSSEAQVGTALMDFLRMGLGDAAIEAALNLKGDLIGAGPTDSQRRVADAAEKALAFFTNINSYDPRVVAVELAEALQGVGRAIEMEVVTSDELIAPVWECAEIGELYDC
jgi:hypothetical protein